jgi:hypothetical protein
VSPLLVRLRLIGLCGCVAVILVAANCGGGITPTAPTQASITLTITPNPVTAALCHPTCPSPSGQAYPFQASMTVTVQESARISGNVDFINVAPVTNDGIVLPVLGYGPDVIIQRSGSNHVAPSGILSFPLGFLYATGTSSAQLNLTVSIQFTDDKGNTLASSVQVKVNDPAS